MTFPGWLPLFSLDMRSPKFLKVRTTQVTSFRLLRTPDVMLVFLDFCLYRLSRIAETNVHMQVL